MITTISNPYSVNFFKYSSSNKKNSVQIKKRTNVNLKGHKILRFRKKFKKQIGTFLSEKPISNQNLMVLKSSIKNRMYNFSLWLKVENYQKVIFYFSKIYEKLSWGPSDWNTLRCLNRLNLTWFKPIATLVFSLKFIIKAFQLFVARSLKLSFNGFTLGNHESYWNLFPYFKSTLNHFWVGSSVFQGRYKNFSFSDKRFKNSIILGKTEKFTKLLLPSRKIINLESKKTTVSKVSLSQTNKKWMSSFSHKASAKSYWGKKPFVRGKAMNVFDHPNGGYKHANKLLRTFAGKKILK